MQIQKKESGLVGLDSSQSACLLQFTKVLAERLKKVMSCVISPYQCAFIEGRQILLPMKSWSIDLRKRRAGF